MMRKLNRLLGVFSWVALVGLASQTLFAQIAPPAGPAQRLPNFQIPAVTLLFDRTLDARGGTDPNNLDVTARRLSEAHQLAQQQVEFAIRFLERNRDSIIRGEIPEFNAVFGNISQRNPAVVLSSRSISGFFEVDEDFPNILEFEGASGAQAASELVPGDEIYFSLPVLPGSSPGSAGFRGVVQDVFITNPADGDGIVILQTPLISAQGIPILQGFIGEVWKVEREEQRGDPSRFDQVLNTFRSIRLALQGVNPSGGTVIADNPPAPITYNGRFVDINSQYGANQVSVPGLGIGGYPADKRTREAGFSNSDSLDHINNITAVNSSTALPLLWTGDNLPSYRQIRINNPNSPTLAPTATVTVTPPTAQLPNGTLVGGTLGGDISRSFYFDRQTIFGAPDNPNQQFVGYAFILDRINHFGRFDENSVALASGSLTRVVQALDAMGQPLVNQITGQPSTRLAELPDVGNEAVQQPKPLQDWQDVVRSFAEFGTNLFPSSSSLGGAFTGVQDVLGTSAAGPLSQFDATNYARFANFFRADPGLGAGGNFEPFGKRASAGFNPVVPLQ